MASTTAPTGGVASLFRYVLLALILVFLAGAMGQFFLAGLSVFDSAAHWSDHRDLGRS
jgi:hypothetical protein